MRLALVEDSPTRLSLSLAQPIERVVREAGADAALEAVDEVSCSFAGEEHRFYLPKGVGAPDTESSSVAAALESDAEIAFVYPPDPSLLDALQKAAADPATYRAPNSQRLFAREAEATAAPLYGGGTALTFVADLSRRATGRRRASLAAYYRLRWKGREAAVAVLERTYGGLGRLAEAAALASQSGPLTGLARGGTFGSAASDAEGRAAVDALERAGLRWSAVGASELSHWKELLDYRKERPDGVGFLSANIVKTSSPAVAEFPPYAVFDASGTKVAVVGLTPPWAAHLLAETGRKDLTIADPVAALGALITRLRAEADIVVALSPLGPSENARLASSTRGLDLVLADDAPFVSYSPPPDTRIEQLDRPLYANPLPPVRAYSPALNLIEIDRRSDGERVDWTIAQKSVLLDDGVNPADGFPESPLEAFAAGRSTEAAILPAAREVFPPAERSGQPSYLARDFWTLAAGLLAQKSGSEAGLLGVSPLSPQTVGPVGESFVRKWLGPSDAPVVARLTGAQLKALADEAEDQKKREDQGLPGTGRPKFVVSGLDPQGRVRGAPLDAAGVYRVATSRTAFDALALPGEPEPTPGLKDAPGAALEELKARAPSASTQTWRDWMLGRPIEETGLWLVNFRDVSLNLRQTKVQSSDAFASVTNARVQGSDELLVGGTLKTDLEYLRREYKWTNTLEMEYAKDRISPRNAPATTNLSSNRIMFLTLGTKRLGGIPYAWLARSWGPAMGLQYDGEFQAVNGLRRKQVYSAFPGVEFFDGSFVRSLTASGILKRDLSRDPPNTQTGLRARALFASTVGPSNAKFEGEFWNNYFFLTNADNASDLRVEGDANAKLTIPIRKYLSVAPFVDFYWFELKTQPSWGYSLMTGISIGFSRLWKPQYEKF